MKIAKPVKRIAIGYIFVYFSFNLFTLNLMPSWLGEWLIKKSLAELSEQESEMKLLMPFASGLIIADFIFWFLELFGIAVNIPFLSIILVVVRLYFHFQLLTNLAHIALLQAPKYEKKILRLRNANVLLVTLSYLLIELQSMLLLMMCMNIIILIWIIAVLFSFAKALQEKESIES